MFITAHARVASPQRGERHRRPDRGVGVLAAVLAHAGHVAANVARMRQRTVERRREQADERVVAVARGARRRTPSPFARARHRRRPTARPSSARSNRCGIRSRSRCRAACRRRSTRGDTRRRPRRARRCRGASRARSVAQRAANVVVAAHRGHRRRSARARCTGRTRATRSRRGPRCPRGSCRRSSRPTPSAASRALPNRSPCSSARTAWSYSVALRRGAGRQVVVRVLARRHRPALEERHDFVEHARRRPWRARSARRRAAARGSRRSIACARRGPPADATNAGRRLRRTGGWRTAAAARARAPDRRARARARPAAGRESRTLRPTGRSRCAPRAGTRASGRRSQPLHNTSNAGSGVSTCTAPSNALPSVAGRGERRLRGTARRGSARTSARAASMSRPAPSTNDTSRVSPGSSSSTTCCAPHGSSAAPTRLDRRARRIAAGAAERAVAAEEFAAIAGRRAQRLVHVEKRDVAPELAVVAVAREQRAGARVFLGHDVHRRARGRTSPSTHSTYAVTPILRAIAGDVAHRHGRHLDAGIARDVHAQRGGEAVLLVLEDRVAEAVPRDVAGAPPCGQRRRRPVPAGVLVAHVERLAARVGDGIVAATASAGTRAH